MASQCPPGSFIYLVKAGDTLYLLAQRYGTTVAALLAANPGINPNALQIGQTICIPGGGPAACPAGSFSYVIQRGDTLFRLAQRYGTSVAAIIAANPGIDPNALQIGQTVCVPLVSACPGGTLYVVQPGDTLFLIATRFDVAVGTLLLFNPGFDPYRIIAGQRLCIPPAQPIPCPGSTYLIGPGENLSLVAEKFTMSAADILIVNPGLRPSEFTPGRTICLPTRTAPV